MSKGSPLKFVRSTLIDVCSSDRCARASHRSDIEAISGVVMETGSMYGWQTARSLGAIVAASEVSN